MLPKKLARAWLSRLRGTPVQALPVVKPGEMFPQISQVSVTLQGVNDGAYGNMGLHELLLVASIAKAIRANCVFEFGTFNGRLSRQIALNLPADGRLFTIDLPQQEIEHTRWRITDTRERAVIRKPVIGAQITDLVQQGKVIQLLGDSAAFDYSTYFGTMDLVIVDACHEYPFVMSDSQNALRLVRSGGLILWHDYARDWPGVVQYLNELSISRQLYQLSGTSIVVHETRTI